MENLYDLLIKAIDFLLITFIFYKLIYYLRGTRAASVLIGLIVALLGLKVATALLTLPGLSWLFGKSLELLAFAIIVIFQPELRRAFTQISINIFRFWRNSKQEIIDELVSAITEMSQRRCGALIVIVRKTDMQQLIDDSITLDCKLKSLLLQSIFYPNSPLHDGAVIIRGDDIVAARAILPLSRSAITSTKGTRHRAALGIAEETDAIVIVVSEETGRISIACDGAFSWDLSEERLKEELNTLLTDKNASKLTDVFENPDDKEGSVNYHGDEPPAE